MNASLSDKIKSTDNKVLFNLKSSINGCKKYTDLHVAKILADIDATVSVKFEKNKIMFSELTSIDTKIDEIIKTNHDVQSTIIL